MYASVVEFQLSPGKTEEAIATIRSSLPDIQGIEGLKQIITIDRGGDQGLIVAIYASQADQVAATERAQEILGRIAHLYADPPERSGCEIAINETF